MNERIREHWPGIRVHYCEGETLWASHGYQVLRSEDAGHSWERITKIPTSLKSRVFQLARPAARLLRLGVRSYVQISPESFLAFSEGRAYRWRYGFDHPVPAGKVRFGSGPLLQGCCADSGRNTYYGEYWSNAKRGAVRIYRAAPDDPNWVVFHEFPAGTIRHVHALQMDPFTDRLWVAAGDRDQECFIGYFEGFPDTPRLMQVVGGNQDSRAVSLMFTANYVYWGSDAGKDSDLGRNWMHRWSRATGETQRLAPIGGPAYYSTVDKGGRLFVSTAIEGSASEPDRFARVWMSKDGESWREIGRWAKDRYPMRFGYGVLAFPHGQATEGRLYVVGQGVEGTPGTWALEV